MRKAILPYDEVYDLFINKGWLRKDVAKYFGIALPTLSEHLAKMGIKKDASQAARDRSRYKNLDLDQLKDMYVNKKMSLSEISQELGLPKVGLGRQITINRLSRIQNGIYPVDLTGQKINKLRVLGISDLKGKRNERLWMCECDCIEKNIVHVTSTVLKNKSRISCGCAKKVCVYKKELGYGEIRAFDWTRIKGGAKIRNWEFDLTVEYVWDLFLIQDRKCALTKLPIDMPSIIEYGRSEHGNVASLDRVDSKIGYIIGNVQWLHKDINLMKQKFSQERFISYCKLISENN